MNVSTSYLEETTFVSISGVVDAGGAGHLYDVLVQAVRLGSPRLVVDVAGVSRITRAGVRGFVVAAKLARARQGEMRISGASAETEATLRDLGFNDLLRFERIAAGTVPPQPRVRRATARPKAGITLDRGACRREAPGALRAGSCPS